MQHELTAWQTRHLSRHFTPAARAASRALRRHWVAAALAAGTLVLLMVGLLQVLQTAVQQGDALRATTRQQGEAFWHCNSLGSPADRHACRHQSLQAPKPGQAPLSTSARLML